jgi:hypothetical protein
MSTTMAFEYPMARPTMFLSSEEREQGGFERRVSEESVSSG